MPVTDTPQAALAAEKPVASAEKEAVASLTGSRNIAVAYEPVVLTEEDAEVLRQIRENPNSPAGRPTRRPRQMADGDSSALR
jgi:hypothetical protein